MAWIPSPYPTVKARTSDGQSNGLLVRIIVILNQHITVAEFRNSKCVDVLAFTQQASFVLVGGCQVLKRPQLECEPGVERMGIWHSSCQGIFGP